MYIVKQSGEIYSNEEFIEYIVSQGFEKDDVINILGAQEKLFTKIENLEDIANDYELQCDEYYQSINCAVQELEAVMEKLKSGKGLTKSNAADKINKIIKNYLNI